MEVREKFSSEDSNKKTDALVVFFCYESLFMQIVKRLRFLNDYYANGSPE